MGWVELWESGKLCECGAWGRDKVGAYVGLTVICCEIEMALVRVGYM